LRARYASFSLLTALNAEISIIPYVIVIIIPVIVGFIIDLLPICTQFVRDFNEILYNWMV